MSVLVCGGKLTYPIKINTEKIGIIGVSYVERLTDYLKYNRHIDKLIFLETVDNNFKEVELYGFTGDITIITNDFEKYQTVNVSEDDELSVEEQDETVSDESVSDETLQQIKDIKKLEGLRVSDIQWEIMNS